ncbi:MAG: 23S rRNA (guanosine(2251)-2'-O)-methyltransferase RlmB [Flavobacteriales bacterium]|nr:23S rRNA (guanosine(2251)-2'-O)-methyltransferase RlmB [Flavobacteriales bacterium]
MSYRSLKQLTAGLHACADALRDGREFERIFIKKGARGAGIEEVIKRAKAKSIPFTFVPLEKLDRLTNVNHQGVVGIHAVIEYQELEDIVPFLFERGKNPLCIILDRITDVRNFGAIVRTAECLGAHCIIIPENGGAQINTEAIKTSAGSIGRLPICRSKDLEKTVKYLQQCGLNVVAASEKGGHLLYQADLSGPLAIIMGSESDGVSDSLLELTDANLKIPMTGDTGSLNVSVALGMFVYEVVKQRNLV